jgi:hypothetical protein
LDRHVRPRTGLGNEGDTAATRKRGAPLKLGERARSRLNRRVGTVDVVEDVDGRRRYGPHYDEAPQDHFIATPESDSARLPADCIELE